MPCCYQRVFKIPHLTNPRQRYETVRFFTTAYIIGHAIVNSILMIVATLIRLKLGLPSECSVAGHFYMSIYTLMAISTFTFIALFIAYIRNQRSGRTEEARGLLLMFLIIVFSEVFVVFMAIIQSAAATNEVENNAEVFMDKNCLDSMQSKHDCCGFNNVTEWQDIELSLSRYQSIEIHIEQYAPISKNYSRRHNLKTFPTASSPDSIFPSSCHCKSRHPSKCINVQQIMTFQNSTSSSGQSGDLSYPSSSNLSSTLNSETVTTVNDTVFSTTCFSSVRNQIKTSYFASGLLAAATAIIQLLLLFFQFYLVRNLQGAGTVADIYRPSENGQENSIPVSQPIRTVSVVTVESPTVSSPI